MPRVSFSLDQVWKERLEAIAAKDARSVAKTVELLVMSCIPEKEQELGIASAPPEKSKPRRSRPGRELQN